SFRVLSHNWKEVVREVVRGAKFIVFNVEGATGGVKYELELIRECGMAGRTIVIGRSGDRKRKSLPVMNTDDTDRKRATAEGGCATRVWPTHTEARF
ncbi:MAG: hypothetical protein ACXVJL_17095, partial [Candidatus Angelobacter sp.]